MSDYPEYLNPFYEDEKSELAKETRKRSNSFSSTFKGFTNTLRKSFRNKSKNKKPDEYYDVEIRRYTLKPPPTRPSTYSSISSLNIQKDNQTCSPALPRSRFRERLAKSHIAVLTEKELEEANPFKEEKDLGTVNPTVERPKRRKKRAPLPPQTNSLQVPNSSSKWSLTSAETDTSYSTYAASECSETEELPESQEESKEVKQIIQEFNRDMKKLTDDTNNNVIVVEEGKTDGVEESNIPTVSVSCAETEDQNEQMTEISMVAAIVRQLEGRTDDEKCRRLPKNEEITLNGCLEDGEEFKKKCVVTLAEPEDTDLDTPPQACSTPVPKIRKNKLAKFEMLGYEQ